MDRLSPQLDVAVIALRDDRHAVRYDQDRTGHRAALGRPGRDADLLAPGGASEVGLHRAARDRELDVGHVFAGLENWDARTHPTDFEHFDWRGFQREYRDYIDLAKLAQLIPVVGAPIGALVNWKLTERLGEMAINGYRARALSRT